MAEKLDERETVSLAEALKMEIFINQALIDLLVDKGILTQEEILAKIESYKNKE
jgi:hypothetical protein